MTATISRLPLMAGGVVAASMGRAGLWAISHFARAPMASTAILAMTTLTVMAASNALYFQKHHHPAPLFGPHVEQVAEAPPVEIKAAPVRVAAPARVAQPKVEPLPDFNNLPEVVSDETTGSVDMATPDGGPMGNIQVFNVQKKLAEMKLFTGKVDGYYGPMTASAIRAFEQSVGMKPEGAITPDVVNAILEAPTLNPVAARQREPMLDQAPVRQQVVAPAVTAEIQPRQTMVPPAKPQSRVIGRVADAGPEEMLDAAGDTAAETLDSIVASLQGVAEPVMTRQVSPPQKVAMTPPAQIDQTPKRAGADNTGTPTSDPVIVSKVQRGLASLGFLAGSDDGVPGEATAKAIRNFEVYYNYKVTGQVTAELVDMLVAAGAVI
jgi:peptidoglycan hydrolase-like protein with peptidoglycan-binding domain